MLFQLIDISFQPWALIGTHAADFTDAARQKHAAIGRRVDERVKMLPQSNNDSIQMFRLQTQQTFWPNVKQNPRDRSINRC